MSAAMQESRTRVDPAEELARLASQIAQLEEVADAWDEHHAGTLAAIKTAIEALNCEAFRRLIRFLREDTACSARLSEAVRDPFIFGVLRFHGLVRDPVEHRIEYALEAIRPFLRGHGGDVELVRLVPPDTVEVRLVGACHGCPASGQTLAEGVERSIKEHCPEIPTIRQVSQPARSTAAVNSSGEQIVHFISPFARAADAGWETICELAQIPDNGLLAHRHGERELLLYRNGDHVSCLDNACAHMGMPLDGGELSEGVLTCPHHGFSYRLETGECLTVPEVQLTVHAVQVLNGQVRARVGK